MQKIGDSNFKRLIGVWNTTGDIKSDEGTLKLIGMDTYELILGGNYMVHKADVLMGNERSETLEIVKLDGSIDKAKMQFFNTKGEDGIMMGSLNSNEFKITGKGLKFEGTINNDNTKIEGKWCMQTEHDKWTDFINLTLEKQKEVAIST